jgi:hypothetical protein
MALRETRGVLKLLGESILDGKTRKYSVIEIGDHHLTNYSATTYMANFLVRALDVDGEVTLYTEGRIIWAVKYPDGTLYRTGASTLPSFILGVITLPIWGLGLFFFYYVYRNKNINKYLDAVAIAAKT